MQFGAWFDLLFAVLEAQLCSFGSRETRVDAFRFRKRNAWMHEPTVEDAAPQSLEVAVLHARELPMWQSACTD